MKYNYKLARVHAVPRGDIVELTLDLGLNILQQQIFKLAWLTVPNKSEEYGPEAAQFTAEWLATKNKLRVVTYPPQNGSYWMADVYSETSHENLSRNLADYLKTLGYDAGYNASWSTP